MSFNSIVPDGQEVEREFDMPAGKPKFRENIFTPEDELALLSIARAHDIYEKLVDAVRDDDNPDAAYALANGTRESFLDWLIKRFKKLELQEKDRISLTSDKGMINDDVNIFSANRGEHWVNVVPSDSIKTVLKALSGFYFQDETGAVSYLHADKTLQVDRPIPICVQFSRAAMFAMEYFEK